ncbi:hypothetical protein [Streptomyces sp. NPDC048269]|uniref:hypothetical protein n=1 Tax=Streptomyces sp. NPDC048269 TaxID=3155753 RepID=UPI003439DDFE
MHGGRAELPAGAAPVGLPAGTELLGGRELPVRPGGRGLAGARYPAALGVGGLAQLVAGAPEEVLDDGSAGGGGDADHTGAQDGPVQPIFEASRAAAIVARELPAT